MTWENLLWWIFITPMGWIGMLCFCALIFSVGASFNAIFRGLLWGHPPMSAEAIKKLQKFADSLDAEKTTKT